MRETVPGWTWLLGGVLTVAVGLAAFLAIENGQRITFRDSPTYLSAAVNLAEGDGYVTDFGDRGKPVDFDSDSHPVVDFPPGYPLVLSLGIRAGMDMEESARLATVLCVAGMAALFYGYTLRRTGSVIAALAFSLISAGISMRSGFSVLSEPLFGLFVVVCVMTASSFLRKASPWLFAAAGLSALAASTVRTVGLPLVVLVALVAWVGFSRVATRVWTSVGILAAGAVLFLSMTAAGTRTLSWHPPDLTTVKVTVDAVVSFLFPPVLSPTIRAGVVAVMVLGLAVWMLLGRRRRESGDRRLVSPKTLGAIAALMFIGLLVVTRALFDSQTNPSARLLYPAVISLLVSCVELTAVERAEERVSRTSIALGVLAVFALTAAVWHSAAGAIELADESSRVFAAEEFTGSESIAVLSAAAGGREVFSNVPDGLWYAGIPGARSLPVTFDPLSLHDNAILTDEMERLADEIEAGALVFYYRSSESSYYLVDEPTVAVIAPCVVVEDDAGVVLVASSNPACPTG